MPQAYAFAGTAMTVPVPASETGGAVVVLHVMKPSGGSAPPHGSDTELGLSDVLSGALSVGTEERIEMRKAQGWTGVPAAAHAPRPDHAGLRREALALRRSRRGRTVTRHFR